MIRDYVELLKPRMVLGNVIVVFAAFFFASRWHIDLTLLLATMAGAALVMAGACAANNYLDRAIDAKMARTQSRALARGSIPPAHALALSVLFLLCGVLLLYRYANPLTAAVAFVGYALYVGAYTLLKPRTPYALFVGALAGATPPVIGYSAVTNTLDSIALFLFLFLFVWQIPHFLAISLYRFEEYTAAGVPLFVRRAPSDSVRLLARKSFFYSLVVLLGFCAALSLAPLFLR